eukprot:SAG31_NODE_19340_length_605_cov_1.043478_1_plen_45_part_01
MIYAKRGECCWYLDRYSCTEKAMEAKGHYRFRKFPARYEPGNFAR